jgi:hypothetical protein
MVGLFYVAQFLGCVTQPSPSRLPPTVPIVATSASLVSPFALRPLRTHVAIAGRLTVGAVRPRAA